MAIMISTVPTGSLSISLQPESESVQPIRRRAAPGTLAAQTRASGSVPVVTGSPAAGTALGTGTAQSTALQPRRPVIAARHEMTVKRGELAGPQEQQFRRSLTQAGMMLLTEQFVIEVRKLIAEQKNVLSLMHDNLPWALEQLYKSFCSVRTAARVLGYSNFATVAARGEVLVCLLNQGILQYETKHFDMLEDTLHLMDGIIQRVARDGHDKRCFSTARTALCLYAAAEPLTQSYQPKPSASSRG